MLEKTVLAMTKAAEWHKGQKYGDKDYFDGHLMPVFDLISGVITNHSYEYKDLVLPVAILHDALEDTDATSIEIVRHFGVNICMMIENLSDQPGKNRRERKLRSYHRIRICQETVMIKVADRLVNMMNCEENNKDLLKMYLREHDTFFAALWHPNQQYQGWWDAMETICERNR